jgi:hypothetical protein
VQEANPSANKTVMQQNVAYGLKEARYWGDYLYPIGRSDITLEKLEELYNLYYQILR